MPTPRPHAGLRRRQKGAKGDKRYAATCKQIVGKGGATHRHQERKYVTMSCHAANRPARATNRDEKNEMALGQGVIVTGGSRSCPAVQCGATVTTALTAQPPFLLR